MKWRHDLPGKTMQQRVIIDKQNKASRVEPNTKDPVPPKEVMQLYDHAFEVLVHRETTSINEKYRATVNYEGYPELISIKMGSTKEEAVDNAVRNLLEENPFDSVKNL
ncbi:hypothetical protein CSV71_05830 [Sporosarcina sp. P21c]|uniref:hypothetical protein n=1 Tax=unclassified Sporosarcina TaxID=2647733 RepID=UPI000C16D2C3|nr:MULTISPECIES: hypothetical protein [unclassified Sporosarcina]PIC67275.1 hypothetical protein CSV78_08045 [Sporosarcina sp. P16a]PIC90219.1 hypothetical protein CSV71_05830 [Sporosarcina sp. P21c]PIC92727.1 hypothetical protein CSV70_08795 [Sporosarcina sp. P25]